MESSGGWWCFRLAEAAFGRGLLAEVAPRPAHGSRGLGLGQERIESRTPAGAVFLGPGAPAAEQSVCRTPQAARGPGPGLATSRPGGKWRVPSRLAQVLVRMCRARGSLWESDGQDATPWEADRVPAARSAREQLRPGSPDPGRLLERGLLEEVTFGLRPVNAEKGNSQEGASPAEQVASEKVLENEKEHMCSRN